MSQIPLTAPSVHQLKQQVNSTNRLIESTQNVFSSPPFNDSVKENPYLFENMDESMLRTNDEYVNKIYKLVEFSF